MTNIAAQQKYTGYALSAKIREPAPLNLKPVASPSYRLGMMELSRIRRASTRKIDVVIMNTGAETWPANGTFQPGKYVNLSYRWFNNKDQVVLEGDRFLFHEPMQSNDQANIPIFLKAPNRPGEYKLIIGPVQEDVSWFPSQSGYKIEVY
jgi:hypothetical protein